MFWDDTFNTPTAVQSIGTFNGGTVYADEGNGLNWQSIIDQGFAVGSQIIGAWGKNPSQQVGTGVLGYGGGYSPAAINQSQAQIQSAIANQNQLAAANAAGQNKANSLDGIFNSLTATVSANPMIFAGLAVGAYLLFREPPRRR